jgi:hypothetical protein
MTEPVRARRLTGEEGRRLQSSCGGGPQHIAPVLAGRQRHAGGGQRLEHGPAARRRAVRIKQRKQPRRVRMSGHLMHRVGIESQASAVAEPMRLLQHPLDVRQRHRSVPHALGPAMPAHRRTARNLHAQNSDDTVPRSPGPPPAAVPSLTLASSTSRPLTPHPFSAARQTAGLARTGKGPRPTHTATTDRSAAAPRPANVSGQRTRRDPRRRLSFRR